MKPEELDTILSILAEQVQEERANAELNRLTILRIGREASKMRDAIWDIEEVLEDKKASQQKKLKQIAKLVEKALYKEDKLKGVPLGWEYQ